MPEPSEDYLYRLVRWAKDGIAGLLLVVGVLTGFAVLVVLGITGAFPETLTVVAALVLAASFMVHSAEVSTPVVRRRTTDDQP